MDRKHLQPLGHVRRPQSPDQLMTLSPQQTVSLQQANAAEQQSQPAVPVASPVPPQQPLQSQPVVPVAQPQPELQQPQPQQPVQQVQVTAPEQVRFTAQQAGVQQAQQQPPLQPTTHMALPSADGQRRTMALPLKVAIASIGLIIVVALGVLVASLLSGSDSVGGLVEDQRDGIAFSRPESWTDSVIENQYAYYTKGGADIAQSAEGIALKSDFIGLKFDTLGTAEKETIRESFEAQFTAAESFFRSGECSEVGESKTTEVQQNGYDIAYLFEASCVRTSTDEPGGRVKMFIGWTDVNLHLFGVAADISAWESDAETLDTIINSVRPVNL